MNPFLVAGCVVLFLDFIWLNLNMDYHKKFFRLVQGGPLKINVIPALIVYILIPFAIVYFAVNEARSLKDAAIKGAILGACMYGLYDLTNLSTLTGWTYRMALSDTLWGTLLCSAASWAAYKFK